MVIFTPAKLGWPRLIAAPQPLAVGFFRPPSVHHSTAGRRCRRRFLLHPFDGGGVLVRHDPTTDLTMLSITVPPPQVL